jgi:hypothetical protein
MISLYLFLCKYLFLPSYISEKLKCNCCYFAQAVGRQIIVKIIKIIAEHSLEKTYKFLSVAY